MRIRPWAAATDVLPRSDARKVVAGRGDKRGATALCEQAPDVVTGNLHRLELDADQRVVGRQRCLVLDEDARLAAGAGAFPHDVAILVAIPDMRAVSEERLDAGTIYTGIGDPIVEVRHQLVFG